VNCPHCGKPINAAAMLGSISTPAVSDNWLSQNLAKICDIVAGKTSEAHLGYGQWEAA